MPGRNPIDMDDTAEREIFRRINTIELSLNDRIHGETALRKEVDRNTKITESLSSKIDDNHAALLKKLEEMSAGKIVKTFLAWVAPVVLASADAEVEITLERRASLPLLPGDDRYRRQVFQQVIV